jgi:predicted ribosome quality control (RQC) complex YloA/Tae2 family protein
LANMGAHLRPLNVNEIAQIAIDLQALVGAQLQDCLQSASEVGLMFYHAGETLWLWFDLSPQRPLVVRIQGKHPPRKKISRPLTLFLRSRFLGRRLESVRADLKQGRVLIFSFHRGASEEAAGPCEIEARLYPRGQNMIARDGKSAVSENKPKEAEPPAPATDGTVVRSWQEIETEWSQEQNVKSAQTLKASAKDAAALERDYLRAIEKKEKALAVLGEELALKTSPLYRDLGEWLKAHGTLDLAPDAPEEWRAFVKVDESVSANIERAFHRAKENERKAEGTKGRLAQLEAEVGELKRRGPQAFQKNLEKAARDGAQNLLARAEAKGRRLKIKEDLEVYIGKSASDNLALLRRAQPFDLWLHLRDQPGSHAILRRARGRDVTDAELIEAGRWVIEQSLGRRADELVGEKHDLLIVECRYVRPIKGDRLGRVHYTHDRVLTVRF